MPKFEKLENQNGDDFAGSIRSALNEIKMPREILASLLELADKSKKDLTGVVASELKKRLKKVDARELLLRLLSEGTIEIDAKIRIVPSAKKKDGAAKKQPRRPKKGHSA